VIAILRSCVFSLGLVVVATTGVRAQQQQPPQPPQPVNPITQGAAAAREARDRDLAAIVPLKVRLIVSKYQGDKKMSSLPYELTIRSDNIPSNIRMVTQVPVPAFGSPKPQTDTANKPIGPFNYRDVGTKIDCMAMRLDNGRFVVNVTIEDSAVYPDDQSSQVRGVPAFRTFRTTNSPILRDGQSTEFTVATDKVSGEVIRAEVTLTVVK
jgi:hypothetical protein